MQAGKLREVISIERRQQSYSTLGHEMGTWKTISSKVRAMVEELNGRELERARQQVAEATIRITIRLPQDVTSLDRVSYKGRTIQIGSVTPIDNYQYAVILGMEAKQ